VTDERRQIHDGDDGDDASTATTRPDVDARETVAIAMRSRVEMPRRARGMCSSLWNFDES